MAEYYAVLNRAIAGLTSAMPETRRAVYDKARNALISQLKAIEPPLPTAEISRQRLELEEAIRRVEREIQTGTLPPPPGRAPAQVAAPTAMRPAPLPAAEALPEGERRSPQEIFRQAIVDAEARGSAAGGTPRPAARERSVQARPPAPVDSSHDDDHDAGPDIGEVGGLVPDMQPRARAPMARGRGVGDPGRSIGEPRLAPDYVGDGEAPAIRPPSTERGREMRLGPAPIDPQIDDVSPPRRPGGRRPVVANDLSDHEPRRRRSFVPLILLLLILVLAGGVGAFAWSQWGKLTSIVASLDKPAPAASTAATATLAVGADDTASTKNGDRLLPPGQTATATPSAPKPSTTATAPTTTTAAAPPANVRPPVAAPTPPALPGATPSDPNRNVRVVGDPSNSTLTVPPPAGSPAASGAATTTTALAAPGTTASGGAKPATGGPAAPGAPTASLSPPATAPQTQAQPAGQAVMQKATLYEEPTDPTVKTGAYAVVGNVAWSFVQTSPDGPEIVGIVTIPDRKMTVKVTIHRNKDASLPASHLVELMITTPPDFPGKGVQTVPTIFMGASDSDAGNVLVGASASIGMGLYWIALSNANKDLTGNMSLMQTRGWFDIHLVYQNGRRASLVLEKGDSGQTAFTKAMSAWQTG